MAELELLNVWQILLSMLVDEDELVRRSAANVVHLLALKFNCGFGKMAAGGVMCLEMRESVSFRNVFALIQNAMYFSLVLRFTLITICEQKAVCINEKKRL